MIIGIVGNGVVGSATAEAFKSHEVRITDRVKSRETHQLPDVLESDLIFICLPTPQELNGLACDTSAIDNFFQYKFPARFREANLVLRSTVPVGYTRKLRETFGLTNLVHSPEFLTARTAKEDACNPTRMLIGGFDIDCAARLHELYNSRWGKGWDCTDPLDPSYEYPCDPVPIFHMTSDETEFVKLFQNSLSAIKIAAMNEGWTLAKAKNLNWDRCLEALLAGGWINPMHTQVPGPDGKFGFGGSCLPKDTASMASLLLAENLRATMCLGANDRNNTDRERKP